jgi:argininosuccinate lyase
VVARPRGVHFNIEKRLTALIGDAARGFNTGARATTQVPQT